MTKHDEISLPVFQGSEDEVLAKLWTICYSYGGENDEEAYAALAQILGGGRFAQCVGERFEVVDPEWSIAQDVYGCEQERECPEATAEQRAAFDARIAELEAGG